MDKLFDSLKNRKDGNITYSYKYYYRESENQHEYVLIAINSSNNKMYEMETIYKQSLQPEGFEERWSQLILNEFTENARKVVNS